MNYLARFAALLAIALLISACNLRPPPKSQAHPDAPRSGPFWEREEQRD